MVGGGIGADASVDLNTIPLAAIERVEIVKDGGATIYGGDAIGGVVNLITRRELAGSEVSALASTTQHGDGAEYDLSFATGYSSDDRRTHLVLSAGYQDHGPVLTGDRAFARSQLRYDFARGTTTPVLSTATPGGRYSWWWSTSSRRKRC